MPLQLLKQMFFTENLKRLTLIFQPLLFCDSKNNNNNTNKKF